MLPAGRGAQQGAGPWREAAPTGDPTLLRRRREEVLLALLLNHSFLLNEFSEDLVGIEFAAGDLDRLRDEILKRHDLQPDLDAEGLKLHLKGTGFAKTVEGVLSAQVLNHAGFARADADAEAVRRGWIHTREQFQQRRLSLQIEDAERDLAADMTDENWARLQQTLLERKDEEDDE
jgi:DNA primase